MTSSVRERARARRQPVRVRSGDVLFVCVIGIVILAFANFSFSDIFGLLYHPVAGLLALVMIVEFLWLKSADRTRIYKLEIDRLRRQLRDDDTLLRETRAYLQLDDPSAEERTQLLDAVNRRL